MGWNRIGEERRVEERKGEQMERKDKDIERKEKGPKHFLLVSSHVLVVVYSLCNPSSSCLHVGFYRLDEPDHYVDGHPLKQIEIL